VTVKKFMPENRLAKSLQDPNGLLFRQALTNAAGNVEKVRDSHMGELEVKLDKLRETANVFAATPSEDTSGALYRLAQDVHCDAGMFGLKDISRAAHSLCELMVSNRPQTALVQGVELHLHAIAALRRKGATVQRSARDLMLEGLEQLSKALPN
jgi:chemotaxis protein histidine kinase CheA